MTHRPLAATQDLSAFGGPPLGPPATPPLTHCPCGLGLRFSLRKNYDLDHHPRPSFGLRRKMPRRSLAADGTRSQRQRSPPTSPRLRRTGRLTASACHAEGSRRRAFLQFFVFHRRAKNLLFSSVFFLSRTKFSISPKARKTPSLSVRPLCVPLKLEI